MTTWFGKAKSRVEVDAGFPGGNIVVEKIRGTRIRVHQDIRDTEGFWFYWCFRVRGAAGRKIHVTFTGRRVFGSRGPASSGDGGITWAWIGKKTSRGGSFTFKIPPGVVDARFCFTIPYTETTLHGFLSRYQDKSMISKDLMCITHKGRKAEKITIENRDMMSKFKILVTARHHACESMASFVLEGFLEHVMGEGNGGDTGGSWFRDHAGIMAIPFVDKDGVEDGDQGKNRRPRDHNRDYDAQTIYPTVLAIKQQVPNWLGGIPAIALDLHCPYLHDEKIQSIGLPDPRQWQALETFSAILEHSQRGSLPFRSADNIPFGQGWNTERNMSQGRAFSSWAWGLPGMLLATTIEIPYATASGMEVTASTARSFGHDLARAVRGFLQGISALK